MAIDRVPVEILLKIFGNLDFNESLKISLVNKKWNAVQESSRIFKEKILVKIDGSSSLSDFVKVFSRSAKKLENLSIERICFKDQLEIIQFLKFLNQETFGKKIKNLKLFQCTFEDHSIFNYLINCFGNCKVIHCEGIELMNLLDRSCIFKSPQWNKLMQLNANQFNEFNQLNQQKQSNELRKLKKLTFLYSTNELLNNFSNNCEMQILKLCLMKSPNEDRKILVDRQALKLLARNAKTLHKLNLYEIYFDDQFLEKSAKIEFEQFKKFSMSFANHLPQQRAVGYESFIAKHVNLEKFKINCLDSIDGPKIEHLLKHLKQLKSLNIVLGPSCNQSHFIDFHKLKNLEKLSIQPARTSSETYEAIIELMTSQQNTNMKNLKLLLTNINLKMVHNIIENFKNLESLDLSAGKSMTCSYVYLLVDKMKKLKVLKIDDCQFNDNSQFISLNKFKIFQKS